MGFAFYLWSDFSFSRVFRLSLALLTPFPPPTFAPSLGEPSQQLFLTSFQPRSRGFSVAVCGHIISVRFAIQVHFLWAESYT